MAGLPGELARLFSDGGAGRALDVELPPGRVVAGAYWLSDAPARSGLWAALRQAHPRSGLWPVIAEPAHGQPELPWETGHFSGPARDAGPAAGRDAAVVLADLWREYVEDVGEEEAGEVEWDALAPFGTQWPGLAPAPSAAPAADPDAVAEQVAEDSGDGTSRLLLVPAARGADVLAVVGWTGSLNHTEDPAGLSAVLRSWEDRFGARLIRLGFDTLLLAVAAPPGTEPEALLVAAEHFAFCPDNIIQGVEPIGSYAAHIRGQHAWSFWWD